MAVDKAVPVWVISTALMVGAPIFALLTRADSEIKEQVKTNTDKNVIQDLDVQRLQLTIESLQRELIAERDHTNDLLNDLNDNLRMLLHDSPAAGIESPVELPDGLDGLLH